MNTTSGSTPDSYLASLLSERGADITHRKNSGIEEVCHRARAQYAHGDADKAAAGFSKGRDLDGPISKGYSEPDGDGRSTVSVNITRPYTNAGTARTADLLLPAGERDNWELKETPVSDIEALRPFVERHLQVSPQLLDMLPPRLMLRLQQDPEVRKLAIAKCRELIKDYLTEADFASKTRRQIKEAGLVGTGVLYGPFPEERKLSPDIKQAVELLIALEPPEIQAARRFELEMKVLRRPALELVPIENLYPDKKCGSSIHKGDHIWHVEPGITKAQLRTLRDKPGYFAEEIDYLLTQEPETVSEVGGPKPKTFEIWRRTGEVNVTKLAAEGIEAPGAEAEAEAADRFAQLQLEFINGRLVKVNQLPTDSQRLPYQFLVWEERTDSPFGIGIPEQIETPQRGLNAAVRAAQDNLGYSVGFGILWMAGLIEPMDGGDDNKYRPYKEYRVLIDSFSALSSKQFTAEDAVKTLEFPNHLDKILPWITYWLQMAEQTTGLPLLLQGQKATDSVGVTNALMGSSTTNLRLFVKHWDDDVCKQVVTELYNWVQLYGPDEAQADAVAKALGSSILVEKELQQQGMMQLMDRTVHPHSGISYRKLEQRLAESWGLNYDDIKRTEEEQQQIEAAAQQPSDSVQVAQIRAENELQIQRMKSQIDEFKAMLDGQLRGESIEQAREAVQTQGLANIAQEVVRSEGQAELQDRAAALDPENPMIQPEPSTDEALEEALDELL
jgi:hypothetical protein